MVYLTPVREYARYYASLWGRGDLYRVEPVGDVVRSVEDTIETWMAPAARVLSVPDRAVLLTMSQRRRLWRMWTAADTSAAGPVTGLVR
jgi:sugar lactone lactonase YvrE